ncbi:MAG: hypothetical protein A2W31_00905, partial [Planctomycetes bacterium RBG_16_64_10]
MAASRWSEIILGDLPPVGDIDDLRIFASGLSIDGPGGTYGRGGPTDVRQDIGLPSQGNMELDLADIAALEDAGQLVELVLHEMGHVLGYGTLWDNLGYLEGAGTDDPRYVGQLATGEYDALSAAAETSIPVENTGGPGTQDAHWRETVFGNELMTGFLDSGVENPLSRVTVASLADVGYVVDLAAADAYALPAGLAASASMVAGGVSGRILALNNDLKVADSLGNVVGVVGASDRFDWLPAASTQNRSALVGANVDLAAQAPAININANSLNHFFVVDQGRSTGPVDLITQFGDNQGPLIRNNHLDNNRLNGMVVRGGPLTTQGVWDDTDIVHVVLDEIFVPDFHTFGGLRLESSPTESLVVKLSGLRAGFTSTGRPLDIDDRIGG